MHRQTREHQQHHINRGYQLIVADPPWEYSNIAVCGVYNQPHYPRMSDEQIARLPVHQLAARGGCVLLLWATGSKLDVAFDVLRRWGFRFRTVAFVWVKVTRSGEPVCGPGMWTRPSTEYCLLATRGKGTNRWVRSRRVRQVIVTQRREHSRKPEEFFERVDELFGKGDELRRVELFARQRRPGWAAWGNEVERFPSASQQ